MCGRYSIATAPEAMRRLFKFTNDTLNLRPNFNCAPTQTLPVVRLNAEGERELVTLEWGLIPFWAKDAKIAYSTINARAEPVAHEPAFERHSKPADA